MKYKKFKKEYLSEVLESWDDKYFYLHTPPPEEFYEEEYRKLAKKLWPRDWLRFELNKFREEKTGLKFN